MLCVVLLDQDIFGGERRCYVWCSYTRTYLVVRDEVMCGADRSGHIWW